MNRIDFRTGQSKLEAEYVRRMESTKSARRMTGKASSTSEQFSVAGVVAQVDAVTDIAGVGAIIQDAWYLEGLGEQETLKRSTKVNKMEDLLPREGAYPVGMLSHQPLKLNPFKRHVLTLKILCLAWCDALLVRFQTGFHAYPHRGFRGSTGGRAG
jgi:hypothetical protein